MVLRGDIVERFWTAVPSQNPYLQELSSRDILFLDPGLLAIRIVFGLTGLGLGAARCDSGSTGLIIEEVGRHCYSIIQ